MDNILKIQHRGIEADALEVGSSVVVESFDENFLCLRVPQTKAQVEAIAAGKAAAKAEKAAEVEAAKAAKAAAAAADAATALTWPAVERRVASPEKQAANMVEMAAAGIPDQRKATT